MYRKPVFISILLLSTVLNLLGESPITETGKPATTRTPFFVFGDLILLLASAEGQQGYFILDTGAPGLILNKKYFSEGAKALKGPETSFGLNGEVKGILAKDVDLEIDERQWKKVYAYLYDLEYLEQVKGIAIHGLIGNQLFRDMELVIDFEHKELILSSLDKNGEWSDPDYFYPTPDVIIPFKRKGHMPYIEASVEGYPLNLGIDSGAGIGLIIHEKEVPLTPFTDPGQPIRIRGLSQNILHTNSFQLKNLTVGNLSYSTLEIAFADLSHINDYFTGLNLDGILGLDLLSQHRTAINFRKKEIYIWIPKEHEDQFVLLNRKKIKEARN